jgi:hypothetical protein
MYEPSKIFRITAFMVAAIVTGVLAYESVKSGKGLPQTQTSVSFLALEEKVMPSGGVALPVRWGDLGEKLVAAGVINEEKFETLYADDSTLKIYAVALLTSGDKGQIAITKENSGVILNLFWALGLANKNPILENGPMQDSQYGGAGKFASTGGWTLAQGNAIDHYSKHVFITLTPDEQTLVETVAKNIYRPCCGNSTYFPDCNHGMAMLGLLELMASQGVTADGMYKTALVINSYWFPDNYLTIAQYFANKGIDWSAVDTKEVLSADYSSAQGYQAMVSKINNPATGRPQGGCKV